MLSQRAVALIIMGTRLYHHLAALERARGARERAKALARLGRAAGDLVRRDAASPRQIQDLANVIAGVAKEAK